MNETTGTARLRRAVRAVILADDERVLLCRFSFPHPALPTGAGACGRPRRRHRAR